MHWDKGTTEFADAADTAATRYTTGSEKVLGLRQDATSFEYFFKSQKKENVII